jgi:metallo-beta-lactamase family protein
MQLTFLGATKTVTGSKYLLNIKNKKILVDCGLFQGFQELSQRNWIPFPVQPSQLEAVILTHAHIDHTGYLPVLIKNGFKGKVYCTAGTRDLCAILLPDSGHLQEEDAARANKYGYSKHKPALPLYTQEDGILAVRSFFPIDFHHRLELLNGVFLTLLPAGHIIGSSLVLIEADNKKILFSGDLGRPRDPVMNPPARLPYVDFLVLESTYGNRLHGQENPMEVMAESIQKTVAQGGSIIIPAFAVGRTQDILYYLYQLKTAKRIPDIPIYLDSPMAQDVSDLMTQYASEHRLSKELCRAICQIAIYTRTPEESKAIDLRKEPAIIISASGMAEGGRILHHLKVFLPDAKNTVLLTGYQVPGTRGDRLQSGEAEIRIHGEMVSVKANIVMLPNMSAHADYQEILEWLKESAHPPRKAFITHGNIESGLALKTEIEHHFTTQCCIPDYLYSETLR